jgi:hypothetical protein
MLFLHSAVYIYIYLYLLYVCDYFQIFGSMECENKLQLQLKLVIYQQMHYLLHLERFNFTQEIT